MAIGGYAYEFEPRSFEVAPQAQQQISPQQIKLREDLANVEQLTDNYYNAYQRMRNFVQEMGQTYGVDVTKPDFTKRGGGDMHRAYQQFEAALQVSANELAQYKKNLEQAQQGVVSGQGRFVRGFNPQAQENVGANISDYYVSNKLLPEVEQARAIRDELYATPDGAQRADALLRPLRDKLQAQIESATSQGQKEYLQDNWNALFGTRWETPASTVNADINANARKALAVGKYKAVVDAGKKYTNDAHGVFEKGSYEIKVNDQGQAVAVKKAGWEGQVFGEYTDAEGRKKQKVGDHVEMTPDGKVMLYFKDKSQDPLRLDNMSADEITTLVFENNPKIQKYEDWNRAVVELGLKDPVTGKVYRENLSTKEDFTQAEAIRQSIPAELEARQQEVIAVENQLKAAAGKTTGRIFTSPGKLTTFNVKGEDINFNPEFGGNTYEISKEDMKKIFPEAEERRKYKTDNLSIQDVIKILRAADYFSTAKPSTETSIDW